MLSNAQLLTHSYYYQFDVFISFFVCYLWKLLGSLAIQVSFAFVFKFTNIQLTGLTESPIKPGTA